MITTTMMKKNESQLISKNTHNSIVVHHLRECALKCVNAILWLQFRKQTHTQLEQIVTVACLRARTHTHHSVRLQCNYDLILNVKLGWMRH